jgi:hypothetical protein
MGLLKSLEQMRYKCDRCSLVSFQAILTPHLQAFTSMQFPSRLKEAINNAKSIYVDTNMSSGSILSSSEPAKNLISYGMATDWSNWQVGGVAGLLTKIIQSLESYGNDSGICGLATSARI